MNGQNRLQSIARQVERILNRIDTPEGQTLGVPGKTLARIDARVRGCVADLCDCRRSEDDETNARPLERFSVALNHFRARRRWGCTSDLDNEAQRGGIDKHGHGSA
jgi:hypothetical protein